MALVQKAFSDIITFSRSSNATRIGPTGLVEYAPHNLVLQSQTFENASWTKNAVSVIANAATAPDGTVTADMLIPSASAGIAPAAFQGITVGLVTHTWSVYAKSAGYTWLMLKAQDATAGTCPTWFNLSTGVVGSTTAGNTNTITSVGNGWYRCTITRVVSNASAFINIQVANADNASTMTGDGVSGIYIWGAQLAVGPYPLDYTPTTSAAVYGPRFDYDPVTLAARGLLVEEQRTNLLLQSEEFDNAYWTKNSVTVSANAAASPNGTVTADKLVENSASAIHYLNVTGILSGSTVYTASVFFKASERSRVQIAGAGGAWGSASTATFDLTSGTVVSFVNWGSASISSVGGGWYRCTVTGTTVSSPSNSQYLQIVLIASGTTQNYTGDGTSGLYLWGAQLEAGSFATSYIPTLASTVTRSADVASVDTLSPWFNATEGSFLGEFEVLGLTGGLLVANDGTNDYASSIIFGEFAAGNSYGLRVFVSTTAQADFTTSDPAVNSIQKFAGGFKSNDFGFTKNGAAASTDTSGSVPSGATAMRIGRAWTGSSANMWIRRIAFYPRKLSSTELQALTA